MEKRDPRTDPHVGDAISRDIKTSLHGCILREVTRAHGGFVFFEQDNGHKTKPRIVSLGQWRNWARNAEVIHTQGASNV